jgi:hypothetical protein
MDATDGIDLRLTVPLDDMKVKTAEAIKANSPKNRNAVEA